MSEPSAFLRISGSLYDEPGSWAIEVDSEGYIVRGLEFDAAGRVVSVTRQDDFGLWNDSMVERNPPGSPGFADFVANVKAEAMPASEFEAIWRAATRLPDEGA